VLLVRADSTDQRAAADRIQVKLFDAGVRVAVEAADAAAFAVRLAAGEYDVALVSVPVLAVRPALAAGEIAFAVRGAAAARRAMSALSGLAGDDAVAAASALGRELDLVPLFAAGVRAAASPALQGLTAGADGALDAGGLWLLRGGAR
jgi:peptide/nickel transport system substrate-binding protein